MAGAGDVDGDGIGDVAVGLYGDDDGGTDRGAVYVLLLNANGTVKAEQKISDTSGGLTATLDDSDWFGGSLAPLGDVDGDGTVDLIVGAPGDDDGGSNRGAAHVLFLNSDGTVKAEGKISDTAGGLTTVLDDGDWFGISVAGLGDLDGNGTVDLGIGAVYDDDGGTNRGAIYILDLGAGACGADADSDGLFNCYEDANTDADDDPATNPGPDTDGDTSADYVDADDDGDSALTALENADPNSDGNPRDAIDSDFDGQPDYLDVPTISTGGVVATEQKISATSGGLTGPLDSFDFLGQGAAPLGDLDGDGIVDLAVGAYQDDDGISSTGAIYILFLNADGTVKAEQKISSTQGGLTGPLDNADQIGRNIAALGDLDGDGNVDIATGAFRDDDGGSNRGAVYILFLNADGTVKAEQKISSTAGGFTGPLADGVEFGRDVAGLGDVDGDGVVDLAVGSTQDNDGGTDRGAVYVLLLNADGTVKAEQKISDTAGGFTATLDNDDEFGVGLAGIGDLDGDGTPDLVVGSGKDDDGAADTGAVHVLFLNADGTVKAEQKISATSGGLTAALTNPLEGGDSFGLEISPVGDLDLDGNVDLAVGAPNDDDGANWAGAVYLLYLNDDGTVRAADKISATSGGLTGPLGSFDNFGYGLAPLGDLDGDGTINLAVGASGDDDGASSAGAIYILDLVDACTLGTGYGSACPFTSLAQVPDDVDGRFWFDFGGGAFQASVASDEGGAWVQVLQYNHEGGTNPNLDVRAAGRRLAGLLGGSPGHRPVGDRGLGPHRAGRSGGHPRRIGRPGAPLVRRDRQPWPGHPLPLPGPRRVPDRHRQQLLHRWHRHHPRPAGRTQRLRLPAPSTTHEYDRSGRPGPHQLPLVPDRRLPLGHSWYRLPLGGRRHLQYGRHPAPGLGPGGPDRGDRELDRRRRRHQRRRRHLLHRRHHRRWEYRVHPAGRHRGGQRLGPGRHHRLRHPQRRRRTTSTTPTTRRPTRSAPRWPPPWMMPRSPISTPTTRWPPSRGGTSPPAVVSRP